MENMYVQARSVSIDYIVLYLLDYLNNWIHAEYIETL